MRRHTSFYVSEDKINFKFNTRIEERKKNERKVIITLETNVANIEIQSFYPIAW